MEGRDVLWYILRNTDMHCILATANKTLMTAMYASQPNETVFVYVDRKYVK